MAAGAVARSGMGFVLQRPELRSRVDAGRERTAADQFAVDQVAPFARLPFLDERVPLAEVDAGAPFLLFARAGPVGISADARLAEVRLREVRLREPPIGLSGR